MHGDTIRLLRIGGIPIRIHASWILIALLVVWSLATSYFPSSAPHLDRAAARPWAGLRPVCADGVPLLGRYGYDNLFLNTGHGHLGWTLACGSARLVTDLMLGRRPELDPRAYAAERRI